MMGARKDDDPRSARAALARALAQYRRGEQDLRSAARSAGVEEWDFLEAAQSLPDPVAPSARDDDLPVFIRDRR
jgi:hypothetical protein